MPTAKFSEIRDIELFEGISEDSFVALMKAAYIQNFPPNVEIITEGETSDFLHVVLTGSVELFANWSNNETTMATVWPVSSFIIAATIRSEPYLMSARTQEKSRIVMVPSADVKDVFEKDAEFAKNVVTELASCYRASIKNAKNLKLRTSKERLANYLLKTQKKSGAGQSFPLKYEKRRLASYLGMTPENLSRAFSALREHGVNVDGQIVHMENPGKLIEFAKPTHLIDE